VIYKSQGHQSLHAGPAPIFVINPEQFKFLFDYELLSCSLYKIPTTFSA